MINNESTLSTTSSSRKCKSVTVTSDGSTYVEETSEHVEVRTQGGEEEENPVLEVHGGSISER